MDVRIVTIIAGVVAALVGVVFLAPDVFGFLGLPPEFEALGLERDITGLALLLLGLLGVLSELEQRRKPRRAAPRLALEDAVPAAAGYNPLEAPLGEAAAQGGDDGPPAAVPFRDTTEAGPVSDEDDRSDR